MKNKLSKNAEKGVQGTIITGLALLIYKFIKEKLPDLDISHELIVSLLAGGFSAIWNLIKRIWKK